MLCIRYLYTGIFPYENLLLFVMNLFNSYGHGSQSTWNSFIIYSNMYPPTATVMAHRVPGIHSSFIPICIPQQLRSWLTEYLEFIHHLFQYVLTPFNLITAKFAQKSVVSWSGISRFSNHISGVLIMIMWVRGALNSLFPVPVSRQKYPHRWFMTSLVWLQKRLSVL